MKLAVAIPMKPLSLAKARLRPSLNDAARRELAVDMLQHVLTAVADCRAVAARGIVSADPAALALARDYDFDAIEEDAPKGYNQAASRAGVWAQTRSCDALLILPADLPFLTTADICHLARLAQLHDRAVVIAPDAAETGTNALLLRPPDIIQTAFGSDSFHRHKKIAQTAKGVTLVFYSSTIAQDIDWPEDLQQFQRGDK